MRRRGEEETKIPRHQDTRLLFSWYCHPMRNARSAIGQLLGIHRHIINTVVLIEDGVRVGDLLMLLFELCTFISDCLRYKTYRFFTHLPS